MDAENIDDLKQVIEQCKEQPSVLNDPSLAFFKNYLQSLGARVSPATESGKNSDAIPDDGLDEDLVESDVELDNSNIVPPDADPPQRMGDLSVEVSEESREFAQELKSKAMDAVSEGKLNEAIGTLTEAIVLNPKSSILYAARGGVFVKLKKPNAAIRDANAALEINPDSSKGYKIRGMARGMLGLWQEAASDLRTASKLDFDDEIHVELKKVEPNVQRLEDHQRKYKRLKMERNLRSRERGKQRQKEEAQPAQMQKAEAESLLNDGQVIVIQSASDLAARLEAAEKTSKLAILYFTAIWCGPCRQMGPVYTSLAAKYPKAVFLKADVDEVLEAAVEWKISSLPTFYLIKNGKQVDEMTGGFRVLLEQKIAQHVS